MELEGYKDCIAAFYARNGGGKEEDICGICEWQLEGDNRAIPTSDLLTTATKYIDVHDEPRHTCIYEDAHLRAMLISLAGGSRPSEWHRHGVDSLYFFLSSGLAASQNTAQDKPIAMPIPFGLVTYAPHSICPLVHQACNCSQTEAFINLDLEIKAVPPTVCSEPLAAPGHEVMNVMRHPLPGNTPEAAPDRTRMYKLALGGEAAAKIVEVRYDFYGLIVPTGAGQLTVVRDGEAAEMEVVVGKPVLKVEPGSYSFSVPAGSSLLLYLVEIIG